MIIGSPKHPAAAVLAAAFASLSTAQALATPPAAPSVDYFGAPKQIRFSWNYVPRANYYEMWFKANAGAAWAKFGDTPSYRPQWTANVSSHLLDWGGMRWDVRACNPGGCTGAGPNGIDIGSTVVLTVGRLTPSSPNSPGTGTALAMSEDARTVVSVARNEYVMGDQHDDYEQAVGYVYRNTGGAWNQDARLLPSVFQRFNGDGAQVSLSGDGNVLAMSVPAEYDDVTDAQVGAVYVFRRGPGGWSEQQRLSSADSAFPADEHFGEFVKLSEDGQQLAVSSRTESIRHVQVFRAAAAGWVPYDSVAGNVTRQTLYDMSADGKHVFLYSRAGTQAVIAEYSISSGAHTLEADIATTLPAGHELSTFAVDYGGATIAAGTRPESVAQSNYDSSTWKPAVTVYRRDPSTTSGYATAAVLRPSKYQPTSYAKRTLFGQTLAMSRNGEYISVYDPHDARSAPGVQLPPTSSYNSYATGSIYLFEKHGSSYRQRRHIGENQGMSTSGSTFGPMAFGQQGKTFIASHRELGGDVWYY